MTSGFNYEQLDGDVSKFLKSKELTMREIVGKAYTEMGRELKEARDELAKHGYGCFEQWYSSIGLKRQNVYRLIERYENLILPFWEERELLESLPVSLTYEIAKPQSEATESKRRAKQAVLKGEVKTLKEYSILESRLKEAEARANQAEQIADSERKARERAEEDADKPPEVVTEYKTEYVDNTPDDYEKIRQENERYREKFGDINSFDGNTRRVSNRHDVMAMIQAFAHDSRQFLRKYSFLDEYAREIADMPESVKDEFKSSVEAINRFVWKMAEHIDDSNSDVIDVDTINH
ncbi:hypothetical protein AB1K91_17610 [Terribacillus sp. 179-K 1B1 HS]|uniref:hypothetical protein n=1 Tax=Terribacillus sp. 179-K 1B1 HS TaxID=3142388 RepID=UPI00399FFA4C